MPCFSSNISWDWDWDWDWDLSYKYKIIKKKRGLVRALGPITMNPISDQALRTALDHEATSIVRQLQADNQRLRNELATAKANLGNRYLRSVLCLIDKHREMGYDGLDVIDHCLVLHGVGDEDDEGGDSQEMLDQLIRFPLEEKLAIIPVLCGLGYWVHARIEH